MTDDESKNILFCFRHICLFRSLVRHFRILQFAIVPRSDRDGIRILFYLSYTRWLVSNRGDLLPSLHWDPFRLMCGCFVWNITEIQQDGRIRSQVGGVSVI